MQHGYGNVKNVLGVEIDRKEYGMEYEDLLNRLEDDRYAKFPGSVPWAIKPTTIREDDEAAARLIRKQAAEIDRLWQIIMSEEDVILDSEI